MKLAATRQQSDRLATLEDRLRSLQSLKSRIDHAGPVDWLRAVAPDISLDPWQQDFMLDGSTRSLLLCSRQVGKSFAVAARAAYHARSHPGSTVLVIAPSYRQSQLLYSKVQRFIHLDPGIQSHRSTQFELELTNGSSVVSLPGDNPDKVRGYTATFVAVDEAAFVRDTVLAALFPMLSTTGGSITMLTTPAGATGVFHNAWTSEEDWTRTKVLATECPRIPTEFIEEAQQRLGDLGFRREYLCEFVSSQDSFFSSDMIAEAFSEEPTTPNMISEAFL